MHLRQSAALWHVMAQHLRREYVGSMHHELDVLIDSRGNLHIPGPHSPNNGDTARRIVRQLMRHVDEVTATRLAAKLMHRMVTANTATLALAGMALGGGGGMLVVARVALKALEHLTCNPRTGDVWFTNGHANAVLMDSKHHVFLLLEPYGATVVKGLATAVCSVLTDGAHAHFLCLDNTMMYATEPAEAHAAPTAIPCCTTWAALAALVALANPVTDEASFWHAVHATYREQHWLMRLFMRLYHLAADELRSSGRDGVHFATMTE